MGNICCLCRIPKYTKTEDHDSASSYRGSSYDAINNYTMLNDYPGINSSIPVYDKKKKQILKINI